MNEDNVCYAKSSPAAALTWITLAFFAGFAGVSAYGPIIAKLKETMAMGPFWLGLLASCPALTGSLLRIPFGAMVDRYGGKITILVLLGLAAIGVAGITMMFALAPTPTSTHYPFFLLFGILCGCGIAIFSVGIPSVSYWYPQKKQGRALALYAGLGNLAPGLFAVVLPSMVVALGFISSYVFWFVMLTILFVLVGRFMKDAPYFQYHQMGIEIDPDALLVACGEELVPSGNAMASIKKASEDWRTWALTFFYFISFGGFIALTVWLPTYWSELFSTGLVTAGMLTALYSLSCSLLRVAGGYIADSLGGEKVVLASFIMVVIGAILMAITTSSFATALAGQMILALGMGFANAAVFKLVPKYSPMSVGGAAGIVGGLGAFGGFVIPPLMGVFVKTYGNSGYAWGYMVFIVLSLAALVVFIILDRRSTAELTKPLTEKM
jgi:NNP family nitrate/nitrite transporter-like MFS transporter